MPPEEGSTVVDRGDDFTPPADLEAQETAPPPVEEVKEEVKTPEKTAEPAKKEAEKGGENLIPRERFNEAVKKEREKAEQAMRRAQELEEQLATRKISEDTAEAQKQIKELIKSRNQMLSDGELEKASEVDSKIIELQDALADHKAEVRSLQAKEMAKEEIRYDTAVSKLESDHPELNPDSPDYDQETVNEIRALMRGYQSEMQLSPSAAITRAAARIFGNNKTGLREEVSEAAEKTASERKSAAVERNIDAAKKQPPSNKEVGLDHDKRGGGLDAKSVMKMSYKDFSALGDDVLARLRGDSL